MRRLRVLLLAAVLAGTLTTIVSAQPAAAAPGGCTSGYLCVYWNVNYDNGPWRFGGSNSSWGAWAIENDDSSWFNNGTSGLAVRVYVDRGYGGGVEICQARGTGDAYAIAIDDRGSSNLWVSHC